MMCLDDLAGDCKSKTGPVRFVSDKWLEDSLLVFGSDAASVVPDLDMQRICLETDRECNDRLLGIRSLFVQCITGITKKIQNCLTELLRDLQIFPGDPREYGKQIRYLYQQ